MFDWLIIILIICYMYIRQNPIYSLLIITGLVIVGYIIYEIVKKKK